MNTSGHHSVAETAGLPVLEEAFTRAGKEPPPLHAFYLGNWLTDVSQAVDPVAYAGALNKVMPKVRGFAKEIKDNFLANALETVGILKDWDANVDRMVKDIEDLVQYWFTPPPGKPRESRIGVAVHRAFYLMGFFRFACPYVKGSMKGKIYEYVFDHQFTQYYPHEHMDRPEKLYYAAQKSSAPDPQDDSKNPFADIPGKGTKSEFRKQSLKPDIYEFLREDIQIAAGLLSEIDYNWAHKTFGDKADFDPASEEWNLWLARLGHALHPIEDFFAHSNFAEFAMLTLKGKAFEDILGDDDKTTFRKRLKKVVSKRGSESPEWEKEPDEENVVTGYFDFSDTTVSLSHIAENLFLTKKGFASRNMPHDHEVDEEEQPSDGSDSFLDFKKSRQNAEIREASKKEAEDKQCVKRFKKLFTETLEFISDPEAAAKDPKNEVAAMYKGKTAPKDPKQVARDVIAAHPLFKETGARENQYFIDAVGLFGENKSIGGVGLNLYLFIKVLSEFLGEPLKVLNWFIGEFLGFPKIAEWAVKTLSKKLYDALGAQRLGCHSLLAKDHGPDGLLYKEQKECALAVHYYVMKTLTRWAEPKPVFLPRVATDSPESGTKMATLDDKPWVEWLELLEYFLRHPSGAVDGGEVLAIRPVTQRYIVQKGDSLATLEKKFKNDAFDKESFSWVDIAEANFPVQGVSGQERARTINRELKRTGRGFLCGDGINYGFNPGIEILIPLRRWKVPAAPPADAQRAWFKFVMLYGWEVFKDGKRFQDHPDGPLSFHTLLYIEEADLKKLIDKGKQMCKQAEDAYSP